jgi:hypothetical protein
LFFLRYRIIRKYDSEEIKKMKKKKKKAELTIK